MSKRVEEYICRKSLEIALALNDKRDDDRKRHYAFVWSGGSLRTIAQNGNYRDPFQNFWDYPKECFIHSEFRAIRRLNEIDCSKFIMVTFRLSKTGLLSNGKPCPYCENFIRHFGFKKVWHSNESREFQELYI